MRYWQEVTPKTVLKHMVELNQILPVDLYEYANKDHPTRFTSWSKENISCVRFNLDNERSGLFDSVVLPHITLAKDQTPEGWRNLNTAYRHFNWEEGLKIGECHVGWKIDGEMQYMTQDEFITYISKEIACNTTSGM